MFAWRGETRARVLALQKIDDGGLKLYIVRTDDPRAVTGLAVIDFADCCFGAAKRRNEILEALLERNADSLAALNLSRNDLCLGSQKPGLSLATALGKLKCLHILDLSYNHLVVTSTGVRYRVLRELGDSLRCAKTLRRLRLAGNNLGSDACGLLASWVDPALLTSLKYVELDDNPLGTHKAVHLPRWSAAAAPAFCASQSGAGAMTLHEPIGGKQEQRPEESFATATEKTLVEQRRPGSGQRSPNGFFSLCNALQACVNLQVLRLRGCMLCDSDAAAVAAAAAYSVSIRALDLAGNAIGTVGAAALATALRSSGTLRELNIADNQILEEGAILLAAAIPHASCLQSVDVSRNGIGPAAKQAMLTALVLNHTIDSCNVDGNLFAAEDEADIADYASANAEIERMRQNPADYQLPTGRACGGSGVPLGPSDAPLTPLQTAILAKMRQRVLSNEALTALRGNQNVMAVGAFRDTIVEQCPWSRHEMLKRNSGAMRKLQLARNAAGSWVAFAKHRSAARSLNASSSKSILASSPSGSFPNVAEESQDAADDRSGDVRRSSSGSSSRRRHSSLESIEDEVHVSVVTEQTLDI